MVDSTIASIEQIEALIGQTIAEIEKGGQKNKERMSSTLTFLGDAANAMSRAWGSALREESE